MKATKATCWKCSSCKKAYPHNDVGKALAEKCCACSVCGVRPSEYTGVGTRCRLCNTEKELASAKEAVAYDQARVDAAEKTLASIRNREARKANPRHSKS